MGPSGMGLTSPSCRARRQRYGVSSAPVSAGSNHVGARVMCIAHVICPVGTPFCARARCREGHPCHNAHPATPLRVRCRKRRRDETRGPGRLDVMLLPPSTCADSCTGTVCLLTRSRIGVRIGPTVSPTATSGGLPPCDAGVPALGAAPDARRLSPGGQGGPNRVPAVPVVRRRSNPRKDTIPSLTHVEQLDDGAWVPFGQQIDKATAASDTPRMADAIARREQPCEVSIEIPGPIAEVLQPLVPRMEKI